ncbi:hypothetical protein [Microbacterium sp. SORGH_AS_0862]|uniref:hypothetical protein n=1 Tax=Microbacterium sp. SORGH_AS_0862 TaxID=3041789 RepID=UPI00278E8CFA|nr:hypothetical protein [Microbacterium sp. SORGH_AS_0862]MDQ1206092.1 hypothetical protein [Microbacterium sp. SORGH_AS_0862]
MSTMIDESTQADQSPEALTSSSRSKLSRRKRSFGIALAALIGLFSVGLVAPAANAAQPASTDAAAEYVLELDGEVYALAEGETAVFPLQRIESPAAPGEVTSRVTYPGDAGTLTVTASSGVYHYSIAMAIPATTFAGAFSIADLSSGLSGGSAPVSSFAGSVTTSKLRGHTYSGTLTGTAFLLGVPVAGTVANNTIYHYTDY